MKKYTVWMKLQVTEFVSFVDRCQSFLDHFDTLAWTIPTFVEPSRVLLVHLLCYIYLSFTIHQYPCCIRTKVDVLNLRRIYVNLSMSGDI